MPGLFEEAAADIVTRKDILIKRQSCTFFGDNEGRHLHLHRLPQAHSMGKETSLAFLILD